MKFLVLCLVLAGPAWAFNLPANNAIQAVQPKFITADLNDYIDKILPHVIKFILENGMDPMDLPDIIEGFEVTPIIITYHGQLELTNGVFHNLRSLRRAGDVKVSYISKIVKISADFALDNIAFNYEYLAKVMNIGPRGGVQGSVRTASVFCEVLVDFNNNEIHLQDFYLYNIGSLSVRFTGNPLVDWLSNALVGVITTLFKNVIMNFVEGTMRKILQDYINEINNNISNTKAYLDHLKAMTVPKVHVPVALPFKF